jgi:type IV pilus assembly protein PilA
MFQKLKNKMKDQRGLTLIELLAVIVILAIISAIAIPSIIGLIENSRKDAHVANALQAINSAKLAYAGDKDIQAAVDTDNEIHVVKVSKLATDGYLEIMKDPDGGAAYDDSSAVVLENDAGKIIYHVYLNGSKHDIGSGVTVATAVQESALKRSVVSP